MPFLMSLWMLASWICHHHLELWPPSLRPKIRPSNQPCPCSASMHASSPESDTGFLKLTSLAGLYFSDTGVNKMMKNIENYTQMSIWKHKILVTLCAQVWWQQAFQFLLFCSWTESGNINTVHYDPEFLPSSQLIMKMVKVCHLQIL